MSWDDIDTMLTLGISFFHDQQLYRHIAGKLTI
jgi:hypothetical protein